MRFQERSWSQHPRKDVYEVHRTLMIYVVFWKRVYLKCDTSENSLINHFKSRG